MKVKTLRAHDYQDFGSKIHKTVGTEYEIADGPLAKQMVSDGLIEEVSDGDGEGGRSSGTGSRTKSAS